MCLGWRCGWLAAVWGWWWGVGLAHSWRMVWSKSEHIKQSLRAGRSLAACVCTISGRRRRGGALSVAWLCAACGLAQACAGGLHAGGWRVWCVLQGSGGWLCAASGSTVLQNLSQPRPYLLLLSHTASLFLHRERLAQPPRQVGVGLVAGVGLIVGPVVGHSVVQQQQDAQQQATEAHLQSSEQHRPEVHIHSLTHVSIANRHSCLATSYLPTSMADWNAVRSYVTNRNAHSTCHRYKFFASVHSLTILMHWLCWSGWACLYRCSACFWKEPPPMNTTHFACTTNTFCSRAT